MSKDGGEAEKLVQLYLRNNWRSTTTAGGISLGAAAEIVIENGLTVHEWNWNY